MASRILGKTHHALPKTNPLTTAIVMALASPAALAGLPPANQLPGQGRMVFGNQGQTLMNGGNLTVNASAADQPVVIQWGGNSASSSTLNPQGIAGFDIGSQATLTLKPGVSAPSSVLNIDASGNSSELLGTLNASGLGAPVFVANANGIVVGNDAVIEAPDGLGLINANLTSPQAQSVFESGAVPISFDGARGGVQIEAGANLSDVEGFVLIAGAGNVDVAGGLAQGVPTVVDAGVGGYFAEGAFHPRDKGQASDMAALSTSNYDSSFVYRDAGDSTVTLDLGSASAPYEANALNVYADGDIHLAQGDNLTNVRTSAMGKTGSFDWSGALVNEGKLSYQMMAMSSGGSMQMMPSMSAQGDIYGNSGEAHYGRMVNADDGVINSGTFYFPMGTAFVNEGTMNLMPMGMMDPMMMITVSKGNIDLAGAVNVAGNGSMTGGSLSMLMLMATTIPGQDVTVHTSSPLKVMDMGAAMNMGGSSMPSTVPAASIDATHARVDSSIMVMGGNFVFEPFGGTKNPVFGTFELGQGSTISAQNISMGAIAMNDTSPFSVYKDATSYQINGTLKAIGTMMKTPSGSMMYMPGTVTFGGSMASSGMGPYANGSQNRPFNITGDGSIVAGTLVLNNPLGEINNIVSRHTFADDPLLQVSSIVINRSGPITHDWQPDANGRNVYRHHKGRHDHDHDH